MAVRHRPAAGPDRRVQGTGRAVLTAPRLVRSLAAALLLAALPVAASAAALVSGAAPEAAPSPAASPEQAISADRAAGEDDRIGSRLTAIFNEVPSLAGVTASVEDGVVTLSGTVADADARARAEAIATRVQGVVTVENALERDVSVGSGLGLTRLQETVGEWTRLLPLTGVAVLVALLIAGLGYLLASLTGLWQRLAPNPFLAELIASAIRFVFTVGGIVVALDMIGAGTLLGAVLGGAGVIGIALGFAMRDTIENYVASLMLSLRQPFRANDLVVIDTYEGRVVRLTSRATILMTLDGNHLRIPNGTVFKAVILNYTRNPQRRFEFDLGIDADDDPTAARHVGIKVLESLDFVLASPEPQARVIEVGDSDIKIRYLGWIDQRETDWFKAKSRAIPAVKEALEAAGFALPEPIYRLRFDGSNPLADAVRGEAPPARRPRRQPPRDPSRSPAGSGTPFAVQDTSAEDEIKQMVHQERATTSGQDLLDSSRPVE